MVRKAPSHSPLAEMKAFLLGINKQAKETFSMYVFALNVWHFLLPLIVWNWLD